VMDCKPSPEGLRALMPPTKDKTMSTQNELHALALRLKCNLFHTRETLSDAMDYAHKVAQASDNPAAVLTAVHVALNSVAEALIEIAAKAEPAAEPLTDDERDAYLHAAHQMHQHGGGFAAALAEAYMRADSNNSQILRSAFAHVFNRYMEQTA
jgi:hypothetical protein